MIVKKNRKNIQRYEEKKRMLLKLPVLDDFLMTMQKLFYVARWFGIPGRGGRCWLVYGVALYLALLALEGAALWKIYRAFSGFAIDITGARSIIARLSGSIFYGNAVLSTALLWRLTRAWPRVSVNWLMTERSTGLELPPDPRLMFRLKLIIWVIAVTSCVEHGLSMISATGLHIAPSEYFREYILNSHGFVLRPDQYSVALAVPIFILSKVETFMWNFQDTVLILISTGLTSRYRRINRCLESFVRVQMRRTKAMDVHEQYADRCTWRKLREAYARQATLVRKMSRALGPLVLLSNSNDFYFICLQLFLGLGGDKPSLIDKLYYFLSLSWLAVRACAVVLAAAEINVHSRMKLPLLQLCPYTAHNVEARRLERQLSQDYVALSAMGFFYLDRYMLLKVAAAILTYELVLLQYDT